MGFWVAVAKAEGSAEITAANRAGESGTLTLTVGSGTPAAPSVVDGPSPTEEPDVRQELVRLINQTRKANGVAELPVSEALMTAAQALSDQRYTWHHTKEECEAVIASGYPYGFGINLTVFTGVATEDAAQPADTQTRVARGPLRPNFWYCDGGSIQTIQGTSTTIL